jgi:hypothetical protein
MSLAIEGLIFKKSIFGASGGRIKSIQSGVVSISSAMEVTANIAINEVDLSQAVVYVSWNGLTWITDSTHNLFNKSARAHLTTATNLQVYSKNGTNTSGSGSAAWWVIEFEGMIKSIQTGLSTISGTNEVVKNTTISEVDTSKSAVLISYTGYGKISSSYNSSFNVMAYLTSSTNLRESIYAGAAYTGTVYSAWQVIEFM